MAVWQALRSSWRWLVAALIGLPIIVLVWRMYAAEREKRQAAESKVRKLRGLVEAMSKAARERRDAAISRDAEMAAVHTQYHLDVARLDVLRAELERTTNAHAVAEAWRRAFGDG